MGCIAPGAPVDFLALLVGSTPRARRNVPPRHLVIPLPQGTRAKSTPAPDSFAPPDFGPRLGQTKALMKALLEFSERFGNMLSRIFLTLLYFLVLGPFAIVYRFVADPLRIAKPKDGNWSAWVASNETLRAARKQD